MSKTITPVLGADSFTCPHCKAISHQTWFKILPSRFEGKERPQQLLYEKIDHETVARIEDEAERKKIQNLIERMEKNEVTYEYLQHGGSSNWQLINCFVSRCYSCEGFVIWLKDKIIYPETDSGVLIHDDLPASMRADVEEAVLVVDKSPRGAAALLRLAIQKLMPELNVNEDTLDKAIGILVKRGLDTKIQQALDVVRVIGNNAVHPGQIDLKDDKAMALKLFTLINLIVEAMITAPRQVAELFESLPEGALKSIERRDATKEKKGGSPAG